MLEQYFSKPDTVDRIRDCWLGEPIERYVAWLSSQGYAARNVRSRVPILRQFAAFVWSRGGRSCCFSDYLTDDFADYFGRRSA